MRPPNGGSRQSPNGEYEGEVSLPLSILKNEDDWFEVLLDHVLPTGSVRLGIQVQGAHQEFLADMPAGLTMPNVVRGMSEVVKDQEFLDKLQSGRPSSTSSQPSSNRASRDAGKVTPDEASIAAAKKRIQERRAERERRKSLASPGASSSSSSSSSSSTAKASANADDGQRSKPQYLFLPMTANSGIPLFRQRPDSNQFDCCVPDDAGVGFRASTDYDDRFTDYPGPAGGEVVVAAGPIRSSADGMQWFPVDRKRWEAENPYESTSEDEVEKTVGPLSAAEQHEANPSLSPKNRKEALKDVPAPSGRVLYLPMTTKNNSLVLFEATDDGRCVAPSPIVTKLLSMLQS